MRLNLPKQSDYNRRIIKIKSPIGGKVYDITGDVTENHKWISWLEYSNKQLKEKITKENIMF
ncbi:hypothetical protein DWV75_03840 [Ruminococcus sp. AF12-5]|nr:hypothetical protein DWV75_03840 [Ruminococcus sp. AF12-5]